MSRPRFGWDIGVLILLVLTFVIGGQLNGDFATQSNMSFVIQDIGEILLIALPMTLIIITGEIDLSVASIIALSSCVMGKAFEAGLPMTLAALVGIGVGGLAGAFNGVLISRLGLSSLAVTIGTLGLFRGLSWALMGDGSVANFPPAWTKLGYESIPGSFLPYVTPLLALLVLVFGVFLHATKGGRWIFAIGQSVDAARFAGIPVAKLKFRLYVLSGLVSGLAGLVYSLRFASARPDAAIGFELAVIAAALFGGVSIFGGVGTMWGVVGSVLFLGAVRSLLQLQNVAPNALTIVTGGLLLSSVIVPALLHRLAQLRRPRAPAPLAPTGVADPVRAVSGA
ncbi:MAG: ABC transporter permease [Mycobacteriales bacterium]